MKGIVEARFGLPHSLQFVGNELTEIGPDVLGGLPGSTVSPECSPVVRSEEHIARLDGEPWRPRT